MYFEHCIYALRHSDDLNKVLRAGGAGTFTENKKWVTGRILLEAAQQNGQKMAIIFAGAESIEGITFVADLKSIEFSKVSNATDYSFSNLRKLPKPIPLDELLKRSTATHLPSNYIHSYVICATPEWVNTPAAASQADDAVFGEIPDIPEGTHFASRLELSRSGIHRPNRANISGTAVEGADSILLSGEVESDQDLGDLIIFTGQHNKQLNRSQHAANQSLTRSNKALVVSQTRCLPVRVVRGSSYRSRYSPESGYSYDGLFLVEDHWFETSKTGDVACRFRLRKLGKDADPAARATITATRLVRNTAVVEKVKALHDFCCQVCGVRLEGPGGPYAEGAHIRGLGHPHDGPDVESNILCLCPNHHTLFDLGAFGIADDLSLIGLPGQLTKATGHTIGLKYLRYHRKHYGFEGF